MLKEIIIEGLYGLYSYTLDLRPDRNPFCFVTGSNGYGKTTLLKMLKSLYRCDFKALSSIKFESLFLKFQDGYQILVNQHREYSNDATSDEIAPKKVDLSFVSNYESESKTKEIYEWSSNSEEDDRLNNMTGYLTSHPIYFIGDNRLLENSKDGTSLESRFQTFLQKLQLELNTRLQKGMMESYAPISKEEYEEKISTAIHK